MATPIVQCLQAQTLSRYLNVKSLCGVGGLMGAILGMGLGGGMFEVLAGMTLAGGIATLSGVILVRLKRKNATANVPVSQDVPSIEANLGEIQNMVNQPAGLSCVAPEEQQKTDVHVSMMETQHLPPEWISPNAAGKRPTHELSAMRH